MPVYFIIWEDNMNIVDMRKVTTENTIILGSNKENIYMLEGLEDRGIYYMNIYRYDKNTCARTKINDETINTQRLYCIHICKENYIMVSAIYNDELRVYKVDLLNDYVSIAASIEVKEEEFTNLIYLGDKYFIYYLDTSDVDSEFYDVDMDIQGEYIHAFLYEIDGGRSHEIKDKRVVLGVRDHLEHYKHNNTEYLMLEEAYMDDYEQEEIYKLDLDISEYHTDSYKESINIVGLDTFINDIYDDKCEISFNVIYSTEKDGWTRYLGNDNDNIYFRTKDFKNQIESIYAIHKDNLVSKVDKTYKHNNNDEIRYDKDKLKVFLIKNDDDKRYVTGIYNSNISDIYHKKLGEFDTVIDEEYILTYYWVEDDEDNYYDYSVIKSVVTDIERKYLGNIYTIGSDVILI